MKKTHEYAKMGPMEFHAEKEKNPVIYCAFGPMEYHGCHNSLGIDPGKAFEICLRAAGITGGIVFPMVPIAPGGSMQLEKMLNRDGLRKTAVKGYPSVVTSIDICRNLYYELFETFAEDLGFKVCVAFGGHAPASVLIKQIADENNGEIKGMKLIAAGSLSHNLDIVKAEYEKLGIRRISHGGLWETVMNMACNPENVDLGKLDKKWPEIFKQYPEKDSPENKATTIEELKLTTAEFGDRLMQISAERIAAEANTLLGRN